MITKEEASNILSLLNRVTVSGQEAITVALLQKKLADIVNAEKKEEKKDDKESKGKE